jgi:DNA-binding response OmpR family regulator
MNLVKKILIVHGDDRTRRRLVLTLVDAGYDLRSYSAADPALETARTEWFDLAIVDAGLPAAPEFAFTEKLKRIQPTVPVVLLVRTLELPLIVKGIRLGLADVLLDAEDPRPLVRRVHSLLRPGEPGAAESELTSAELAEVEAALARLNENAPTDPAAPAQAAPDLRQELMRVARERADLEQRLERMAHEKAALETELRTLLAQTADGVRMQAELQELQTQREMAESAQAAIDAKARQLAETRAEIARERSALEETRRQIEAANPPATRAEADLAAERASLGALDRELHAEKERLRDEAARIRQEANQIAQERRRWHEDLEMFATQEENLRKYEQRLRELQAQLESDRVLWRQGRVEPSHSPFKDDEALRAAWEKLQRATELLEADRAVFRDERMLLRDQELSLKRREEAFRLAEQRLAEAESLPRLPAGGTSPGSMLSRVTRSPFGLWGKTKP